MGLFAQKRNKVTDCWDYQKDCLTLHMKTIINVKWRMKKLLLTLVAFWCMTAIAGAQAFDEHFADSTLRLDYVLAGNNHEQHIYFGKASRMSRWAGRKNRLADMPLKGNGQLILSDHATGRQLYVHTFSTLFQEWQASEEATRVNRAFNVSFNVPLPKHPVDINITLTNFHGKVVGQLQHTLNPADILIRQVKEPQVPFRYMWKGQAQSDGEPDITRCIDLAVVAEGYTHSQMEKFYSDCQRLVDALFAHEPFTSMKSRFNVVVVAAESADSGPSIPHLGRWHSTAVGTHYDTFYSDRYLMTHDMHRLYDLLAGIPFEHIIVLVNSDTYGGGGIYNQLTVTTSDHPTFRQVLVHEFGHAYGGLGDEYFYDDSYETMYPADTEPWEPNLTTLKDFGSKWADMLLAGTKIPTPPIKLPNYKQIKTDKERRQLNAATQRLGVFVGGGYQSKGVYRPAQECRMKINEVEDFCPVCSRALVRITDFYTSQQNSHK